MRILITGGAGCLGANLVDHYLPKGHDILVIDNFATSRPEALPSSEKLKVVEGSVANAEIVNRACDAFRPTHLIHSAAAYKNPDDWREDSSTNVLGMVNVVDAARRFGIQRLINFQTALCYGRPERVPIPIDHPLRPFTSYSISKAAAEQYLLISGLPFVSLRLANVTGPRLAIGPIPTFYKRLKTGQSCFCTEAVRDFLDMDDFLAIVDAAMETGAPTGIFNVSTGGGATIREVYDAVAGHLGIASEVPVKVVPVGDDDISAVVLDPRETIRQFGWTAQYDFAQTMRRTLAWYDTHGVTDVFSHLKPAASRTA